MTSKPIVDQGHLRGLAKGREESPLLWNVIVTTSPVTKLVAEAWLTSKKADLSRTICISRRGFYVSGCAKYVDVADKRKGWCRIEWLRVYRRDCAKILRCVKDSTGDAGFVFLRPGVTDPREHLLHVARRCKGVYYAEEGSFSMQKWEFQTHLYWKLAAIQLFCLLTIGRSLLDLRILELFMAVPRRVLGFVAISPEAFPDREHVQVLSAPRVPEDRFDAIFLGDPLVEVGQLSMEERERWLEAVSSDLSLRGVCRLGVRVHPSEQHYDFKSYKEYFKERVGIALQIERADLPIETIEVSAKIPLYQLRSSAAQYAKRNGFLVVSKRVASVAADRFLAQHHKRISDLIEKDVDVWI